MNRRSIRSAPGVGLALGVGLASSAILFGAQATPSFAATGSSYTSKIATFRMKQSPQLDGIAFVTPRLGWLVGGNAIFRTEDGGQHLVRQYRGPIPLQNVSALNQEHVVAWGYLGAEMTDNGGKAWHALTVPQAGHNRGQLMSMQFISTKVGFASVGLASGSKALYRTTNAGSSWHRVPLPTGTVAEGFANVHTGWALVSFANQGFNGIKRGSGDGFYRTTDGGQHWVRTQGESASSWFVMGGTIDAISKDTAYAQVLGGAGMSQSSSTIFRTTNGVTWKPVLATSTAGGGPAPGVLRQKVAKGPGYDAGPFVVIGSNDLRVIGGMEANALGEMSIAQSNDGGGKWRVSPPIPGANGMPTGSSALSFVNAKDGWLLDGWSNSPNLLRTTDGGATWRQVYPDAASWPVMGVDFTSRSSGYGIGVVGDVNQVVRTTNGGRTWTPVSRLPVKNNLMYQGPNMGQGISFARSADGFAVGGDGHLYLTTDSGKSWRFVSTPAAAGRVLAVRMVTKKSVTKESVVIDTGNGVYASSNEGHVWKHVVSGSPQSGNTAWLQTINRLNGGGLSSGLSILGSNRMAVASFAGMRGAVRWIQLDGYNFLISVDAGKHWTMYSFHGNAPFMMADMGYTSLNNGWMWTLQGQLFVTTDGGQKWVQMG